MRRVYLDHNATTPLRPEVLQVLGEVQARLRGNPSSLHAAGREARQALDEARERTAAALGVHEDEIVFTSGGTESNNMALGGILRAAARRCGAGSAGLVTTSIEHSSILGTARRLEGEGHPVERLGVDACGRVDLATALEGALRPGTRLVSIMAANNEVGSLGPIGALGEVLRERPDRPVLHTDAVQALGKVPLELRSWGIDLASFSAHKLGGPAGVGILFRRAGVVLEPLMSGGEQEGGLRPGTESVAGAVATALAVELAVEERSRLAARLQQLASVLWTEVARALPAATLLGPPLEDEHRLPGTLNVLLPGVEGKVLVTRLDLAGLEASAGSACASGSLEPSHVLRAMGLDEDDARAGLRLSLGRTTTLEDVRQAVDILRTSLGSPRAKRSVGTGL